ncbi:hypothetical protein [Vannielia sp.]|uniref:hypothetical protein n=1 Tax=Vannielia sp. TaxID=2813045 RepID=UPI002636AAF3|nr:hypothetical protein [Vannielia sp.]MDF1871765.1 hypothetical protein [Vannielia sp.]
MLTPFSLFTSIFRRKPRAEPARPLPEGMMRLHLFGGIFGSEAAARDYLFGPVEVDLIDAPAPMTVDLPDAFVNADFVRMSWGIGKEALLAEYFRGEALMDAVHITSPFDTLALLPEEGLGGVPFRLHDTPKLRYLGAFLVTAP